MNTPRDDETTHGNCGSYLFLSCGSADFSMGTETNDFRVIVLTHGGADAVLLRLNEIEGVSVVGVFIELQRPPTRSFAEKIRRSLKYDGFWGTVGKPFRPWPPNGSVPQDATEETASKLGVPVHHVCDYHAAEAIEQMNAAGADLGVIFGTNIIKESVFSIPRLGSINLHQGLVPYYRGGPPVFWELYNGESEVGITVHRVAAKVDAGEVVLQETVPLRYDFDRFDLDFESFIEDFRSGIRDRCASLVAAGVRRIADGTAAFTPQDISLGTRYKLPTKPEKDEMKRRLLERRRTSGSPAPTETTG
jgi:folate-dependent phosphoribosylglycinamide formyltransferase PurN